ncbi:MAG TPA: TetR/AcrR family transcriptional regulator [Solirubrobacterales bacterium]|nr:TetR/AcrR family transcriptional regulator [Solirubrobacterales bacterium]
MRGRADKAHDGDAAPADRRGAILVAAARLIAREGVRGLRVEEVASEAGVSPPLLYYHFASRSGLIKAALEHASEHAPSAALRSAPEGEDGFTAVENALLAELGDDRAVRDNAVVWGEVSASAVFEPALRDDVRRVTEEWSATVASAIRRGMDDGSIGLTEADPEEAAEVLITLVDGLCARWLSGAMERERARELLAAAIARILG